MAKVTDTHLTITSDERKETSHCVVTCKVNFTSFELSEMKEGLRFKLDCQLWGDDSGLNGADNSLFTYSTQFFPDASPAATETATFDATLGTSVLNEDVGSDEIYAKAVLTNTYTGQVRSGKSNVISRKF